MTNQVLDMEQERDDALKQAKKGGAGGGGAQFGGNLSHYLGLLRRKVSYEIGEGYVL